MTDRDLLELAAKAAGLVIDKTTTNGGGLGNTGFDALGNAILDWHNGKKWNPLTDDGDALRLSTKLRITIKHPNPSDLGDGYITASVHEIQYRYLFLKQMWVTEEFDSDEQAAVRRAIVRIAAEIGSKKK